MKTIYTTTVTKIGPLAEGFLGEKMIVLFNDNAPDELAEFCVIHKGNELVDTICEGDILKINGQEYPIIKFGEVVQDNLGNLGHITIKFDGAKTDEILEGSLHVEEKEAQLPDVGSTIEIIRK